MKIVFLLLIFALVPLASDAYAHSPQSGETYIVNTTTDADDGTCNAANCTLREAMNAANLNSGADTITFSVGGTITLGSTLPAINDHLTIDGNSQSIVISGDDVVQVMRVNKGMTVNVNHLTILNSTDSGITNTGGRLGVTDSIFVGNTVGISNFGAVNSDATLYVVNSTFSLNSGIGIENNRQFSNAAIGVSGTSFLNNGSAGIFDSFDGKLTISNSIFSGNTGDGITTYGIANVTGSTFSGNIGSGIASHQKVTVTNSTLTGNHSRGVMGWDGIISVTNSTLLDNRISGIHNGGVLTVRNTIIAKSPGGVDCYSTFGTITADSTHNLGDDDSCGSSFTTSNQINLGTLEDNGGPTYTMALLAGSAAIDTGDNATCLDSSTVNNKDQRGSTRITQENPVCDIGAYEVQPNSCAAKPTKPSLKSPDYDVAVQTLRPKLKWYAATCADTYTVVVKDTTTGKNADKEKGLTTLKYKTEPLPANTLLKWFVKACNNVGCTKSAKWQFKIIDR